MFKLWGYFTIAAAVFLILAALIQMFRKKSYQTDALDSDWNFPLPYTACFGLLLALAAFVRFYRIAELPAGMHADEAGMAYDAFCLANYGTERYLHRLPVYLINYDSGQSALYAYLCAFFMKFLGTSIYAIRLPAFLSGMCVVTFGGLITKELSGRKLSLIATFLLSICPYYMMASRFGFDCNLLLGFSTIVLYLLIKSVQKQKTGLFVLTGIFLGISLYTYSLSWIIFPIFLFFTVLYLLMNRQMRLKHIIALGAPAGILAVPLFAFLYTNTYRTEALVTPFFTAPIIPTFRADNFKLSNIADNWDVLKILLTRDQYIFNSFDNFYTLYVVSIPLVLFGIFLLCKRLVLSIKNREPDLSMIVLFYFIAQLICGLIITNPDIYRMNGIYFTLMFCIVLSIKEFAQRIKWKKAVTAFLLFLYSVNAIVFLRFYFTSYESTYSTQWFINDHITEIFEELAETAPEKDIYVDKFNEPLYAYDMLVKEVSPYDFCLTNHPDMSDQTYGNMHYYLPEPEEIREDAMYIVMDYNGFKDYPEGQGFSKEVYGYYALYYKE